METNIYVFKTNVTNHCQVNLLKPLLNKIECIKDWNFDLQNPDDKILRVVSSKNVSDKIISLFHKNDLVCFELHADVSNKLTGRCKIIDLEGFIRLLRLSALILLLGGIVFWIGAATPPYRQWMTRDTGEYLAIIHYNSTNWYFMHSVFIGGVLLTMVGTLLMSEAFRKTNQTVWPTIASSTSIFGSIFLVLNIAFRVTLTTDAAKEFMLEKSIDSVFQSWMRWSNLIFAVYMMFGYFSCAALGYAFTKTNIVPVWVSRFGMCFGALGFITYPLGFVFFEPPLMIHLPFMILSAALLKRIGWR
jgi:hypothetical protein